MKAVLSNRIYLQVTPEQVEALDQELTYKIKAYRQDLPPIIIKNIGLVRPGIITLPSGREDLIPEGYEIVDKRILVPVDFPERLTPLYPSQEEIYEAVNSSCMINASVSWGKTFTALAIAGKLGQKTLVVTHTTNLRDQWVDEVKKMYKFRPGIIGSGQCNTTTPIVIGNVQSLYKKITEISRMFGTIIVDECLDYNSYITTESGQQTIGTIVNSKKFCKVLSFNESTKEFEWKPILRHFKNEHKDLMIKFTFDNKSVLKCTLNHTVYSYQKGKVSAELLMEGDYVIVNKGISPIDAFENFSVQKIIDITFEKAIGGYRYNIEVADNHNYLSGYKLVGNCHHVSSPTFTKIVDKSYATYKIGLSGTLERKDGRHIVFPDYFTSKVFKPTKENYMVPKVNVIKSEIRFMDGTAVPWAIKVNDLAFNEEYQRTVAMIATVYAKKGHKVLVVSDRVRFLKVCAELCGNDAISVTGEASRAVRAQAARMINSGEKKILFGTQSIFSEGVSINELSCLILGTPVNNTPLLTQLIGRILRISEGKLQPIIIDLHLKGSTASRQANARLTHYLNESYDIKVI